MAIVRVGKIMSLEKKKSSFSLECSQIPIKCKWALEIIFKLPEKRDLLLL